MRKTIFIILMLKVVFALPQGKIELDTVELRYQIKGIKNVTSKIPQIRSGVNQIAKEKINADIRQHFMASILKDSADYVRDLLKEHELSTVQEYLALSEEELMPDEEKELFDISYLSQELLNFTYSYQVLPYRGRYQFFFKSRLYDIRTGKKLNFDDFLSIEKDTLISILRKNGYSITAQSDPDNPFLIESIDEKDAYIEANIEYLFEQNQKNSCIDFYFTEKGHGLQLMFKFKCAGPFLLDYGLGFALLKPYIKYSEFKNRYKLWGRNIYALMGYDYLTIGDKIEFDAYSIENSGSGFLLLKDSGDAPYYGVAICHSASQSYYLLVKYQTVNDKKCATITDILEIDKNDLRENKLIESCETKNGSGPGILALVKKETSNPKYYTKIIKAWRANRKTGKFESVKKTTIKHCNNENYGI